MSPQRSRHWIAVCLLAVLSTGLYAQQTTVQTETINLSPPPQTTPQNNLIQIDPVQVKVTNTQVNANPQPSPGPNVTTTAGKSTTDQHLTTGYLTPLGNPLCGGIVNGKLQVSCGYTKAQFLGKARQNCPAGSFFDAGTWSCYTCPPGYNRTGNHVAQWDACSKDVRDQISRASYEGKVQSAPAGAKLDPRNGGEYWSCPSGLDRTWAAVDAWDACGMIGKEPKSASFVKKACVKGWHDPRNGGECWSCPAGFTRTAAAVDQSNACVRTEDLKPATKQAALTCEAGDHFDFVDGGTCWRCPKDTTRTFMSVKGNEACDYQNVLRWQPPKRTVPGLFGLDGAEAIALEILAHPKEIDALVMQSAKRRNGNPEQWIAQEWAIIKKDPASSPILNAALMTRLMDAASVPAAKRSPAEARFVNAVEKSIRDNKIFLADQAQQYYDNWVAKRTAEIAKLNPQSQMVARLGTPPEAGDVVKGAIVESAGALALTGVGIWGMVGGSTAQFVAIAPHATQAAVNTAIHAVTVAKRLGEGVEAAMHALKAAQAAAQAGVTSAGSGVGAVASAAAGPLIIMTGTAIALEYMIREAVDAERVRISTKNNVETAKKNVNLGVLLQMTDGGEQLMYHWGMMTGAPSRPGQAFFARVAAVAAEKGVGPVTFDIVSEASTCLQATGTKLALVACNRANPTRWISKQGALVPLGNEGMCLTANGPTLVQCQPTNPQWMQQQMWRLESAGQIVSGTGLMLVAKDGSVANMPLNPAQAGGKWKAETR